MKTKVKCCDDDQKKQMLQEIQDLRLTFVFQCTGRSCPDGKSGWIRFVFSDAFTGEILQDILPILN